MNKKIKLLFFIAIIQMASYGQETFTDRVQINQSNNPYPSLNITTRQGLFNGGHPHIYFLNTGGTSATPTVTPANKVLGTVIYSGYDGQSNVQIGRVSVRSTGDFSPGNYPARMDFRLGGSTACCGTIRMSIDGETGNVGIGTLDTGSHKLAVEGSIGSREVVVESGTWSDFVFYEDYDLPTLEEVENHIQKEGHLPNIPSEKEVKENGINLGQMDAKLLRKIEELTLYTIEQDKEIKRLKTIEKRLAEIEKLIRTNN